MKHPSHHKKTVACRAVGILAACALAATAVGGSLAWYSKGSSLGNLFNRGTADPTIVEHFDQDAGIKRDVAVEIPKNETNVASYVRTRVDIFWQGADGERLWEQPVARSEGGESSAAYDYEIEWGHMGDPGARSIWVRAKDGLYYWSSPVAPGSATGPLIRTCKENRRYDDGRRLVVAISTQTIQADPGQAFDESWGPHSGLAAGKDGVLLDSGVSGR